MKWIFVLLFISYNTLYSQYIDSIAIPCSNQNRFTFYIIPDVDTEYFWGMQGVGEPIMEWNHGIEIDLLNESGTRTIYAYGKREGCYTDTVQYKVTLLGCSLVYIPNAFSPNGDGINDIFYVRGNVELVTFKIYNRWGENIFHTRDINQGWDGTYKYTPCPMEVYVYYVIVIKDGETHLYKGDITLIR